MLEHMNNLLKIQGSKLLFGGEELENHSIPAVYGAIKPTAVFVPIEEILKDDNYQLVTREIFGPFQVTLSVPSILFFHFEVLLFFFTPHLFLRLQIVTEYKDTQLSMVLDALEKMHAHLTAAVVSNDVLFLQVS